MRIILVASQKGKVGKTTVAVNLASAIALSGGRIILVDADPLGGAASTLKLSNEQSVGLKSLGLHSEAPLWRNVVPGMDVTSPYLDASTAHTLDEFISLLESSPAFAPYPLVLIDGPPLVGGMLHRRLLYAANQVILVVRVEPLAFKTLPTFMQMIKSVRNDGSNVELSGILLTLPADEPAAIEIETVLRQAFIQHLLPQTIHFDPEIAQAAAVGKPVILIDPNSAAAKEFAHLAQQLGLIDSNENGAVDLFRETPANPSLGSPPINDLRHLTDEPTGMWIPEIHTPKESDSLSAQQGDAAQLTNPAREEGTPVPTPESIRTAGTKDLIVKFWEATSPADRGPFRGHAGDVKSIAFSPDGSLMATGSWDRTVKIWSIETGEERNTLKGHGSVVACVAFSPSGDTLATASWDKTVRLWRVRTGQPLNILKGHSGVVTAVAYSRAGDLIVTGGWDKTIRLWDPATGNVLGVLQGHERMVTSVAISPDGLWLVSGGWDKTVRIWSRETLTCRAVLRGHAGDIDSVAFSPDSRLVASGALDHTARVWDPSRDQPLFILRGHTAHVTGVEFSPDGKLLATAGWDRSVRLWNVANGQPVANLSGHAGSVLSVTFSPDGKLLASSSLDRSVKFWDVGTHKELGALQVQSSNEAKAVSPAAAALLKETPPPRRLICARNPVSRRGIHPFFHDAIAIEQGLTSANPNFTANGCDSSCGYVESARRGGFICGRLVDASRDADPP